MCVFIGPHALLVISQLDTLAINFCIERYILQFFVAVVAVVVDDDVVDAIDPKQHLSRTKSMKTIYTP